MKPVNEVKLPEAAIAILRQCNDDSDKAAWAIGDVSAALVDELGEEYGKMAVRYKIADESGLAPATVRDREEMARYWLPEERKRFEVLSYSALRTCKGGNLGDKQKALYYAQWAVESADDFGGHPAPVRVIRAKVKRAGDALPVWIRRWDRWVELTGLLVLDENAPAEVVRLAKQVLSLANQVDQQLGSGVK